VRITGSGSSYRLAYWDSGRPGVGQRRFERHPSRAAAEARAVELRRELAHGGLIRTELSLDDAMQTFLDDRRRKRLNANTTKQYRSDYNCLVPEEVGVLSLGSLTRQHWVAILDAATTDATSLASIKRITRTLNALITFSEEREYFGTALPFGCPASVRAAIAKRAREEVTVALRLVAERTRGITLEHCPDFPDIEELANAVERHYPGYGYRLVWLAAGTGLRISELLALDPEQVDLTNGTVHVLAQLDRNRHWPAVAPPKSKREREALIWTCVLPVAASLVEDASRPDAPDGGRLFPRHRSDTAWADQAGKLVGAAIGEIQWAWKFRWLRHAYASYLLAPVSAGGFGQDPDDVRKWLGHAKLSTTLDTYVQAPRGGLDRARQATATLPGGTNVALRAFGHRST
jgi:integrase